MILSFKIREYHWGCFLDYDPSNFLLAHDRSKPITFINIPQPKLRDTTIFKPHMHYGKFLFKIQFKMREQFMVVTDDRKYLFVHKVIPENTQKKTSHVEQ